jgi:sporulation protein YlmC with PRC-barrel domain
MKSKLLSGVAIPALLALGTATALAQDAPAPSPSPTAPAERIAPAPEASPSVTMPAPRTGSSSSLSEQAATDFRSSKLVGLSVYNSANERVGDINDLILAADGKINAVVIGVGGFLGMGEKLVALPFADVKIDHDSNGAMRASVSESKESLESAPDFKYYTANRS